MRLTRLVWAVAAPATMLLTPSAGPAQVTAGQIDTFEGGTSGSLMNWSQGINAPQGSLVVATGGPAGAADHFMQITADSTSLGGNRLTAFNRVQWLGNYNTAGITAIEMDLNALTAASPLSMRIAFKSGTSTISPGYVSNPFTLPNDGQWHHAVFPLDAADFTAINSPTAFGTFMSSPAEFRVIQSSAPSLNGNAIDAVVGVDNIHAIGQPVPEPTGVLLAAAGVSFLAGSLRRRR